MNEAISKRKVTFKPKDDPILTEKIISDIEYKMSSFLADRI